MRRALGLRPLASFVAVVVLACGGPGSAVVAQSSDEAQRLAARIRDRLVESRARLEKYGYFEEDTEIKLDRSGGEEERETRVYLVSPAPKGGEPDSRLVSVNGKPPSEDEREEDEERRERDREDVESRSTSASQRRRAAVEDLRRGLVVKIEGRETVDGHQATVLSFEPRPGAHLQSRVGRFVRVMRGRVWATDAGHVVRVEARLDSAVSVGWGLIARIWQGSWLRVNQQPHDGSWLPRELTAEAQGRTLLFRTFHTRYAVRYWGYRLGAAPEPTLSPPSQPADAAAEGSPGSSAPGSPPRRR
ncbi:MAG TPA: hypothetical protein VHJ77_12145 [Vicinamibacterales bacterium]|jgi:hypothetical protein|nr:hypothetical protein [Vicinamibacterales bacterium]